MKFCKITLKVLVVLLILCLGFFLGVWGESARHQTNDFQYEFEHAFQCEFYPHVFNTTEKLEEYYTVMKGEGIADAKRVCPLLYLGPLGFFVDSDSGEFSVREELFTLIPTLALKSQEQSKHQKIGSLVEKDWTVRRFNAQFFYSTDGIYESGSFNVLREDGTPVRTYFDDNATGVFNRMEVLENDVPVTYHLNGLTWKRVDAQPESLPPGGLNYQPNVNTQK